MELVSALEIQILGAEGSLYHEERECLDERMPAIIKSKKKIWKMMDPENVTMNVQSATEAKPEGHAVVEPGNDRNNDTLADKGMFSQVKLTG